MYTSIFILLAASMANGAILRRARPTSPVVTLGQDIPTSAKADNTFSNGKPNLVSEPPVVADVPSEIYGARDIDLPFGRLYHGDMKFFSKGQLNSPDGISDAWLTGVTGVVDSAKQSACGIPDNAFSISKVAIHPYFLKYAPLDRYCMQDVCISFWNGKLAGQGQSDMILKVTDICSTDPNDPTHCATPGDIKIDRTKAKIMEQLPADQSLSDMDQFYDGVSKKTSETWWFFTKCWADALVQPAYTDNWFAQPPIPNNLDWSQQTEFKQFQNNQKNYPNANPPHPTYPNGAYNQTYVDIPITDWSPNEQEVSWCPIAGGKGWGIPTGDCAGGSSQKPTKPQSSSSSSVSTPDTPTPSAVSSAGVAADQVSTSSVAAPQGSSSSTTSATAGTPSTDTSSSTDGSTTHDSPSEQGNSGSQETISTQGSDEGEDGEGDDDDDDTCEW